MRILFLGPAASKVCGFLRTRHEVFQQEAPLELSRLLEDRPDWIVSHGYRHLVRRDVLQAFPGKIINLHISYLPWNRGADPNFWSFLDATPKGVTIHQIDEGIDTGPILVQRLVEFKSEETLATSYECLQDAIFQLFCDNWTGISSGELRGRSQAGPGTVHRKKDIEPFLHLLASRGFETYAKEIEGFGVLMRKGTGR